MSKLYQTTLPSPTDCHERKPVKHDNLESSPRKCCHFLVTKYTIFKFACKTVISSAIRAGPKRNQKDFL